MFSENTHHEKVSAYCNIKNRPDEGVQLLFQTLFFLYDNN
jgi:hypothetical protein